MLHHSIQKPCKVRGINVLYNNMNNNLIHETNTNQSFKELSW